MDILHRNARCPICKRFYHNIDTHQNPIPSVKNKRTEGSLCQCKRGKDARELRRQTRTDMIAEKERKEERRQSILSAHTRNKEYWQEVRE